MRFNTCISLLSLLFKSPFFQPLQYESAWVIANIASGTTAHVIAVVEHGAVPYLLKLLDHNNMDLVEQSLWALSNVAGDSVHHRDMLIQNYPVCALMIKVIKKVVEDFGFAHRLRPLRTAVWGMVNLLRGMAAT